MKLSKTNYLVYRDCAHNAWVEAHLTEVYKAKPSVFDPAIIETGNEVDALARDLSLDAASCDRARCLSNPSVYLGAVSPNTRRYHLGSVSLS